MKQYSRRSLVATVFVGLLDLRPHSTLTPEQTSRSKRNTMKKFLAKN